MLKKKRLPWVDMAKGIAIILMVVGHELTLDNSIRTFIFSFHMPLFFILSGFTSGAVLTYGKLKTNFIKMLRKIFFLAILMIILLGFEYLLFKETTFSEMLHNDLLGIFWGSNRYGEHALNSVGIMWFLFVFFWAKMLFDFLQVFFKGKYCGVVLGILSYFAYLISQHHWLPQALDIVPIAALFMWIGSFVHHYYESDKFNNANNVSIVITICYVYWIICIQQNLYIEMSVRHYPDFIISILEATAGTLAISYLSVAFSHLKFLNVIQTVGKHTLAIMCIHQLDLYWVWWGKYFESSSYLAALVRLVVDLSILLIFLLVQYKILNNNRAHRRKSAKI